MRLKDCLKKFIGPFMILTIILPSIASTTVYATEKTDTDSQEVQVEHNAKELEYIFTKLYNKEANGQFIKNEHEVKNSNYSEKELSDIDIFVTAMNEGVKEQPTPRAWNDTIKRCIADGKKVSQQVLNEIGREIQKGNWIAAAGKLDGAVGMAIPGALAFLVFCRAVPASR